MARTLNRNKPYGTIAGRPGGDIPTNAKYEQNGLYFDQFGSEVGGKYLPADDGDKVQDLAAENLALRKRIAELEGKPLVNDGNPVTKEPEEHTEPLDRMAILVQLQERNIKYHGGMKTEKLHQLLLDSLDADAA